MRNYIFPQMKYIFRLSKYDFKIFFSVCLCIKNWRTKKKKNIFSLKTVSLFTISTTKNIYISVKNVKMKKIRFFYFKYLMVYKMHLSSRGYNGRILFRQEPFALYERRVCPCNSKVSCCFLTSKATV